MRTVDGSVPIEQLKPGDYILSRNEQDPEGPVSARQVEEVFVRQGYVLDLRVQGQLIRTTEEHPFYRAGDGWVAAWELCPGDQLMGQGGQILEVESVTQTGIVETVYNVRVADWHTYFVGCNEWGFSVWAHNACAIVRQHPYEFEGNVLRQGHWSIEIRSDNSSSYTHLEPTDGNVDTKVYTAAELNPGPTTKEVQLNITDPGAALAIAEATRMHSMPTLGIPYVAGYRDCVWYVCHILKVAGVPNVPDEPTGGQPSLNQYRYVRRL